MRTPRAGLQDVVLDDDDDGDGENGSGENGDGENGSGENGDGAPTAPEPGGSDPGPVRRFVRRWRWPVAGVVVLALAVPSVVGSRRETARLADLADVPGILAPLDGPVRELWTTADYPYPFTFDLGGVLVGVAFNVADMADANEVPDPIVHGVDARTGRELWSMSLGGQPGGTSCVPAAGPVTGPHQAVLVCVVVDSVANVPAGDASADAPGKSSWNPPERVHLAVLDPRTGRVLREQPAASGDGLVSFGTDVVRTAKVDGGTDVARLDPRTGRVVWTSHHAVVAGELAQSGYAERHDDGLFVSAGSQAWVLSAAGEVLDEWDVAAADGWAMLQAGGHVLRGVYQSNTEGLVFTDLATDVTITPPSGSSPRQGVDDGSVPGLLFTSGADLVAWDLDTGQRRWQVMGAGDGAVDSTVVLDGALYAVRYGVVSAVDGQTGEELWQVRTELSGPFDLATDGRSLVVLGRVSGSATSTVRAVSRTDGSTLWDAPLTHPVQSLEVSAGHLFAQTDEGTFVALG